MGAKENILARIRAAVSEIPPAEAIPETNLRICEPENPLNKDELIAEFAKRWTLVGGDYHFAHSNEELTDILRTLLSPMAGGTVAVQDDVTGLFPDLDKLLSETGLMRINSDPASSADAAAGITTVFRAMAYSGSLVVSSNRTGELTASLVPPIHIALVPIDRLVYGFKEVFDAFSREGRPRGAAFITGPSRTADIELTLVMGVHGPAAVHAILFES